MPAVGNMTGRFDYDERRAEELGEKLIAVQDATYAALRMNSCSDADRGRIEEKCRGIIDGQGVLEGYGPGELRRALYYAEYWNAHRAAAAACAAGLKPSDWAGYAYEAHMAR